MRMPQVGDSLVDCQATAHTENVDGDQKGVEVEHLAMAVWVQCIWRARALLNSHQQEQFVAGIRGGMECFGQNGGTPVTTAATYFETAIAMFAMRPE